MPGRRLAIFGPSPISGMEAFTQTLLAELRRAGDGVVPDWIHVDTSISRSVSERERMRAGKVVRPDLWIAILAHGL